MQSQLIKYFFKSNLMHCMEILLHTKSIHTPYTDSGILGMSTNKKSLKTICFEAFLSGADETRTRDLLRDRQAF